MRTQSQYAHQMIDNLMAPYDYNTCTRYTDATVAVKQGSYESTHYALNAD